MDTQQHRRASDVASDLALRDWLLVDKPPSWNDIDPSMYDFEIRTKVEDIVLLSGTKPWLDVGRTMNPDMYQIVMDCLQAALESQPVKSGPARHAAIKSLQALNRISGLLPSKLELEDVEIGRIIAAGSYSDVMLGRYDSRFVCVRSLRVPLLAAGDDARKVEKLFRREALLWRQLCHSRILPLLGIGTSTVNGFCLVSPWLDNGNVNEFLGKHPTFDRSKMVLDIIEGVEYLHTHKPPIVHANIRGANILVRDDFTCCLSDFGLAMAIETRVTRSSRVNQGALYWRSPEALECSGVRIPARDIYSFGCTVIEIYSGIHPFPDIKDSSRLLHEVKELKKKPPRPKKLTDAALWKIVESCLAFQPERRPTATDVSYLLKRLPSSLAPLSWRRTGTRSAGQGPSSRRMLRPLYEDTRHSGEHQGLSAMQETGTILSPDTPRSHITLPCQKPYPVCEDSLPLGTHSNHSVQDNLKVPFLPPLCQNQCPYLLSPNPIHHSPWHLSWLVSLILRVRNWRRMSTKWDACGQKSASSQLSYQEKLSKLCKETPVSISSCTLPRERHFSSSRPEMVDVELAIDLPPSIMGGTVGVEYDALTAFSVDSVLWPESDMYTKTVADVCSMSGASSTIKVVPSFLCSAGLAHNPNKVTWQGVSGAGSGTSKLQDAGCPVTSLDQKKYVVDADCLGDFAWQGPGTQEEQGSAEDDSKLQQDWLQINTSSGDEWEISLVEGHVSQEFQTRSAYKGNGSSLASKINFCLRSMASFKMRSAGHPRALRGPNNVSWRDIDSTMSTPQEINKVVEDIICQPLATPWADVEALNPVLHQNVMDVLQAILDHSPATESGFVREAAIKSLQAISRISGNLPTAMTLENVELENKKAIARGGFSDIYFGTYQSQKVCMKVVRFYTSNDSSSQAAKSFRQEALLWRQLNHPRVLPLLGIADKSPSFCMLSPWMENGNINKFLQAHPHHDRMKMLLEIIEGITYLHTHHPPIVHADIRGANILVGNDLCCCLADFGLTMVMETRAPTESRLGQGATHWMPPEVWLYNSGTYIPARDIYSFGCTIIEIYTGRPPFPDVKRDAAILYEVVQKKRKPPRPEEITNTALWDIVQSCLKYEAEKRPAASHVYDMLKVLSSRFG